VVSQLSGGVEDTAGEETENTSGAAKHEIVGRERLAPDRNPRIARDTHPAIEIELPSKIGG
jgi:hypothetical protein